ncbi:MAG: hypothetical protein A2234_04435 [Elusimicrobia bacterium RIFOXYA2_FULL_58_8]|nr:MAG: hypothetical protein A2285_08215 [Elusimicrobia bacterium RIFOXYA12_FULL_57_11]OGS16992.1 MAG: hypothetical protein A2234_04435 [Elusimicrobia bacterium RIFOXYA2_FULL_58_8]
MKYWAYVNNEILGPFEKDSLLKLPAFTPSLLICPQTPVGEKTEDWKEAATYPEISAAMTPGTLQSAPAISQEQPSITQPGRDLKSLTPAPVDPVPPKESNLSGVPVEVNHLERSGHTAPAQTPVAQSASSFDPISISSIAKKADMLAATEIPAIVQENFPSKETQQSFPAPVPEPIQPAGIESFQHPAIVQASVTVPNNHALEELERKLETLAQNAISRQDLAAAADPLKMKLDQMGEVLANMKNSQFQREIMDKLAYLENAVGEIRSGLKDKPAQAAPLQEVKVKPAPAISPKTTVIVDQGSRGFSIGAIFGAIIGFIFKTIMTLALLSAVAFAAAIALKNAGVFDASKFIPFPVPFLSSGAGTAATAATAENTRTTAAMAQFEALTSAQPEAKTETNTMPDASPEIIYFARYYTASAGGAKLEDKILEITAAAGGNYSQANWQAKKLGPDLYEAAAVIPVKTGNMTFTYSVDYAKKILIPVDPAGKTAFDALGNTTAAKAKKTGRKASNKSINKTAAATPAAKAKAGTAAAKKPAKPEDEYEYVYEDE